MDPRRNETFVLRPPGATKAEKVQSCPRMASSNKSIRFPNDLIEQVEDAIRGQDCTFSAFVVEAVRVALENLQDDED